MTSRTTLRRLTMLVALTGVVFVNGCLAGLERNLDILFAPDALGNTLAAPYSPVRQIVEFFARWVYG